MFKILKVLFHIDESVMWELVVKNLNNFLKDYDGEVQINVVANADAVNGYLDARVVNKLKNFPANVTFIACRNSLKMEKISEDALPEFVQKVQSGVVEIAKLEEEGYKYIKP